MSPLRQLRLLGREVRVSAVDKDTIVMCSRQACKAALDGFESIGRAGASAEAIAPVAAVILAHLLHPKASDQ